MTKKMNSILSLMHSIAGKPVYTKWQILPHLGLHFAPHCAKGRPLLSHVQKLRTFLYNEADIDLYTRQIKKKDK